VYERRARDEAWPRTEDPGGGDVRFDPTDRMRERHVAPRRAAAPGVGQAHKGKRVILRVDGLDVRVVSQDGELLRHLQLDTSPDYQAQGS
jgi:hypothetical protein